MIRILHTDASHPDFRSLISALDAELHVRDGDDHAFYAQFNGIDSIPYTVVAYLDEVPVGSGAIKPYADGVMEIKRMFVHPEYRNKGIASQVLLALEEKCRALNIHTCILETGLKQPEAIQLYTKNNYRRIPNYGQYADVADSVCFEKVL